MIRHTSIEAYNHIKNNNLLGEMKFKFYDALYQAGPMTASEAADYIQKKGVKLSKLGIGSRLSELKAMSVVVEVGKRKCRITGQTVIEWDVTDRIPRKIIIKTINDKKRLDYLLQNFCLCTGFRNRMDIDKKILIDDKCW